MTRFQEWAPKILRGLQSEFRLVLDDAAAIVGNLAHESAGFEHLQEIKPTIAGSRGGYGIAQWTGHRRKLFENYARMHDLAIDGYDANYNFLVFELHGVQARALVEVRKGRGLMDKVMKFERFYEGSGVKHYPSRLLWAQRALAAAQGQSL